MLDKAKFDDWYKKNMKRLLTAEFTRRASEFRPETPENLPQRKKIFSGLKDQIYNEAYMGTVAAHLDSEHPTSPLPENAVIAAQCTTTKRNTIFSLPITFDAQLDTGPVASQLSVNHSVDDSVNEDAALLQQYAGMETLTDEEIRLALLQTFMELGERTRRMRDGAVFTLTYVSADKIYVLNSGDAPVYLYNADTKQTSILNRLHDYYDVYERQDLPRRGGIFTNDNRVSFSMNGSLEITRSLGDSKHGKSINGVLNLPTLSVVNKPQNGMLLACSDGISKVFDPKEIGEAAAVAQSIGQNLAPSIVRAAWGGARDDVTAVDVGLRAGMLAAVVDGHGVPDKLDQNRVVLEIVTNLDQVFINCVAEVTEQRVTPSHAAAGSSNAFKKK